MPKVALHAQVVTPNPVPTIITTAPYIISKPGFYQLGANLTYAGNGAANDAIITINASNVTLDFAGHYISGPGTNAATELFGVFAHERGNLNIQNGTLTYCYWGVVLEGNNQIGSLDINQRVNNLLISHCYSVGILFTAATNSAATNNRISYIGGTTASYINLPEVNYNLGGSGHAYGLACIYGGGNSATANVISNLTATTENFGICDLENAELVVTGNTISKFAASGLGITMCDVAVNNIVTNCTLGLSYVNKYANNTTSGCSTPCQYNGTGGGYNF